MSNEGNAPTDEFQPGVITTTLGTATNRYARFMADNVNVSGATAVTRRVNAKDLVVGKATTYTGGPFTIDTSILASSIVFTFPTNISMGWIFAYTDDYTSSTMAAYVIRSTNQSAILDTASTTENPTVQRVGSPQINLLIANSSLNSLRFSTNTGTLSNVYFRIWVHTNIVSST